MNRFNHGKQHMYGVLCYVNNQSESVEKIFYQIIYIIARCRTTLG